MCCLLLRLKTDFLCCCRVAEMAASEESSTTQMIGNAFVQQYYSILHQEPDQVHRFYQESSILSRPEEDGTMTMVTTTLVSTSNGWSIGYCNDIRSYMIADLAHV